MSRRAMSEQEERGTPLDVGGGGLRLGRSWGLFQLAVDEARSQRTGRRGRTRVGVRKEHRRRTCSKFYRVPTEGNAPEERRGEEDIQ